MPGEALEARRCRGGRVRDSGPLPSTSSLGGELAGRGVSSRHDRSAVVPGGVEHLEAEADVAQHAVLLGASPEVGLDLGLGRVGLGPVRVGCERERVEVRRDVAAAAGVGVVAPGAADVVGPLEDDVLDVPIGEPDRGGEAGEPRADDDRSGVGHGPGTYRRRPLAP